MTPFATTVLALLVSGSPIESAPSSDEVRATIDRAIPFVEQGGVDWIDQRDCVSCHTVGNMVWSLSVAKSKGFEVSDQLGQWIDWSIESLLAKNDKGKIVAKSNREGVAQLLLMFAKNRPQEHANQIGELVKLIETGQQDNGAWKAAGQLPFQKRAAQETNDVSTMWITLGLLSQAELGKDSEIIRHALKRIDQSPPGKSTEWYAARLLIAKKRNRTKQIAELIATLRDRQQSDGGWPWLAGDDSDAFGTGLALYALHEAEVDATDSSIVRAMRFLLDTQRDDGSWAVRGTKAKKKDSIEETAVYWGTTWAMLALVRGVDDRPPRGGE